MAKGITLNADGEPDGRGRSEGSKAHQFKPGGKGGPGRPKGSPNLRSIYLQAAAMPVSYTPGQGRKPRKISTAHAVVLTIRKKALDGDLRAAASFLASVAEHSPIEVPEDINAAALEADEALVAATLQRLRGPMQLPPAISAADRVSPGAGDK